MIRILIYFVMNVIGYNSTVPYKNIYIIGAGYVGLANGVMLAKRSKITFIDIDSEKIEKINNGICPIEEPELQAAFKKYSVNIDAETSMSSIKKSSLAILCLPTNYDERLNHFDTTILESVIEKIHLLGKKINIVIKSTVPIGFTKKMAQRFKGSSILFSPEFLREGRSFLDAVNPERIIISPVSEDAKRVASLFSNSAKHFHKENLLLMESCEAESVKLFANTYLAMRIAFINEIDSFCEEKELNAKNVISGICKDTRIGEGYNNPSFGYGGYCFPKDTRQAKQSFKNISESLISSIIESNEIRFSFISKKILEKGIKKIGFYRLNMKSGSDNIRSSSIIRVLNLIKNEDIEISIYEPLKFDSNLLESDNISITNDLNSFLESSDLIVANRISKEIEHKIDKVYTRDIFFEN